jgi:hypothetical protein
VTEANEAEIMRAVNELRARESRILRELSRTSLTDTLTRRNLEAQLATVSREAFTVMSVIEERCLEQRSLAPNGYLGVTITTEVQVVEPGSILAPLARDASVDAKVVQDDDAVDLAAELRQVGGPLVEPDLAVLLGLDGPLGDGHDDVVDHVVRESDSPWHASPRGRAARARSNPIGLPFARILAPRPGSGL